MKLAVVGMGYVGLVTGTCFAESGNDVTCIDVDERKLRMLAAGKLPIYEPGLEELVKKNRAANRLHFTQDFTEAVRGAQVVFIAVGTPEGESGEADLQYVLAAAEQLGRTMREYKVIVTKSTVPVGTADQIRE